MSVKMTVSLACYFVHPRLRVFRSPGRDMITLILDGEELRSIDMYSALLTIRTDQQMYDFVKRSYDSYTRRRNCLNPDEGIE